MSETPQPRRTKSRSSKSFCPGGRWILLGQVTQLGCGSRVLCPRRPRPISLRASNPTKVPGRNHPALRDAARKDPPNEEGDHHGRHNLSSPGSIVLVATPAPGGDGRGSAGPLRPGGAGRRRAVAPGRPSSHRHCRERTRRSERGARRDKRRGTLPHRACGGRAAVAHPGRSTQPGRRARLSRPAAHSGSLGVQVQRRLSRVQARNRPRRQGRHSRRHPR